MNKIELLLKDMSYFVSSCVGYSNGLPLNTLHDKNVLSSYIKEFCKDLIIDAIADLGHGESVSEWLDDYINSKVEPIEEDMVKVTVSTLKQFNYQKVFYSTGIDIEYHKNINTNDSVTFEITKEQFDLLFK